MFAWLGGARAHCDVRLVVSGRALPAHRAVLASASPFLKGILLSCPVEESPTCIVLPDYDLEAMSSILYYIYNGEVTIEKHKIEMCLDIIKSMQIYVDYQYLPYEYKLNGDVNKITNTLQSENVFRVDLDNKTDQNYVEIKKGKPFRESPKHISSVYDFPHKEKGFAESKAHNLLEKAQFEDRQRNSFLRDLFIETYSGNGKVNGQTSVRAISNERFYGATSTLSSNVNSKHLNSEDAPTQPSNKETYHTQCSSMEMQNQEVHYQHIHNQINGRIHPIQMSHDGGTASNFAEIVHLSRNVQNFNTHHFPTPLRSQYFSSHLPKDDFNESLETYNSCSDESLRDKQLQKKNITCRIPILNHVLDSPWSARKPANFIPIHKQDEHFIQKCIKGTEVKEHDKVDENDSNNNIATEVKDIPNDAKDLTITSNDNKSLKCTKCEQTFLTTESLSEHTRCHTGRYTCPDCGKNFSQLRNFKYHMSVHRGTKEFAATCPVCGKYFNDRGYLSSHMKIHRNRKEYKCSMCPKSFNQRVAYNMHVRIHTGVKPHVCCECGKAFSRKMLLKQHQRTHSGERPYACPHCEKKFADRSNMTLHLRLHTGVKPFSCTFCPKSFTKKHHLKSHLNFHTGAKPYSCPNCNLAFTQSSNMRTHMKKCTTTPSCENTTAGC